MLCSMSMVPGHGQAGRGPWVGCGYTRTPTPELKAPALSPEPLSCGSACSGCAARRGAGLQGLLGFLVWNWIFTCWKQFSVLPFWEKAVKKLQVPQTFQFQWNSTVWFIHVSKPKNLHLVCSGALWLTVRSHSKANLQISRGNGSWLGSMHQAHAELQDAGLVAVNVGCGSSGHPPWEGACWRLIGKEGVSKNAFGVLMLEDVWINHNLSC